ncbi:YfiH family protein [Polaromonas sp. CG_9.5]|uniref:peptidoglycan editing factor PgeF n=1 Tax=Polaromonas sp. CG_9.5 TaxID=3071705 RepID=UPI002E0CE732|nr:YfiH family protein [Polaromonas sp. CG_9.5]
MHTAFHPDWLVPDWPAPPGVRAVFTRRAGGVSAVPFDSMNLGDHVGDLPASVAENRLVLQRATGAHMVFMNQVHGVDTLQLDAASPQGQRADACVTTQRSLACTVMVADCLPVLLTTQDGTVVAAAHAGWRGLAGAGISSGCGVLESVYASFSALVQAAHAQAAIKSIAWLGPCIGPSAFEVGEEVKTAFMARQPEAAQFFVPTGPGKYLANLPGLARLRLQALGVTQVYGNDGSAPWCTVSNSSFFSHRRDAGILGNGFGTTGRMAACIWRD